MLPLPRLGIPVKITQATSAPIQHFARRFIYDDFIRKRRRAKSSWFRFERDGRRDDLNSAIAHQQAALDSCSHGIIDRGLTLDDLARYLYTRYTGWGEFHDLELAILLNRASLDLRPEGHLNRSVSLINLATSLSTRFERQGRMKDLEEAITLLRAALNILPEYHPECSISLNNLANSLRMRFEQQGRSGDLEEAIALDRAALHLLPEGHPERPLSLNNLALSLWTRFAQRGRMEDLEEGITLHYAALVLLPEGHPERSISLNNLANSLRTRFLQRGRMEDLEDAITLYRAALDLQPEGHPYRSMSLNNLATSLWTRFQQQGRTEDLEEAITFQCAALDLLPEGHPNRSISMINLALSLWTRFEQRGQMEDLEQSMTLHRAALALLPEGRPERPVSANNLATSLLTRFEQQGRMEDLEEAITFQCAALDLLPEGHPNRSISMINLANSLWTRFTHRGQTKDLEEAITIHRTALQLLPEGHPERSLSLNSLASTLLTRFRQQGRTEDLEEAIALHRAALDLRPEGHPDHPMILNDLANSLWTRFEHQGRSEDLEEAIALYHISLDHLPEGHPNRSMSLNNLAVSLGARFDQGGRTEDLVEAVQCYRNSADHSFSSFSNRIEAAKRWVEVARDHHHQSLPEAHKTALSLLQRALTIRHTLSAQHRFLFDNSLHRSLALDAASYAIEQGNFHQAFELLEQGRALLWSQLRGFRSPLDRLSQVNEPLAQAFSVCNRRLELLISSSDSLTKSARMGFNGSFASGTFQERGLDEKLAHIRRLFEEQESLIKEIRQIPGFEDFLRVAPFKDIQRAASEGPVIVLNYSKYRCDALIVLSQAINSCICVPLDDDFYSDAAKLHREFSQVRQEFKESSNEHDEILRRVMKFLWDRIVFKVVHKLKEVGVKEGSHIWWCPTSVLSAFPFHAAGPYEDADGTVKYLLDDYISSYTPTLSSLINARSGKVCTRKEERMLFVGDTGLWSVDKERKAIMSIGGLRKRYLIDEKATPKAVLEMLQKVRWVHFACHGQLDGDPFESSFALPGGRLTLLDIARANLPNAEFAFLSACHTAEQGTGYAFDEVLHLAAAMQFCGFRSVVGTMWKLLDRDGPFLANAVYKYLMRDLEDEEIRFKRGAAAVREAALVLREYGEPDPDTGKLMTERWVNLVHIGA